MSDGPTPELPETKQTPLRTPSVAADGAADGLTPHDQFELLEQIGQGGMGVVYKARDHTFGRVVAVKVVRPGRDTGRFVVEARVTAGLQHPAIPPVYALGTLADGRPFLAMKLIKGHTLATLLDARPDPAHEFGRHLATFEQVAQAVAFAHARGVVHRDLKPHNVMVDAFGEVQVMDWGLAKVLSEAPAPGGPRSDTDTGPATHIEAGRAADDTRAGTALGTPAYMPPEQAIGAVEQIDARSDVFGLGAILCEVLTGCPPYTRGDYESTRQLAARAKLDGALARLDACGAEPELVALCKRCLAPERDDRPRGAGEVAAAVAELRAGAERRAREAELDRVRAEGERARAEVYAAEQRKRRRAQLALLAVVSGSVLLLVTGVGGFAWWEDRRDEERRIEQIQREADQRQQAQDERDARAARTRDRVATTLGQLPALYRQARWREAEKVVDEANGMAQVGEDPALLERVARGREEGKRVKALDELRIARIAAGGGKWHRDGGRAYRVYFLTLGYDFVTAETPERRARLAAQLADDPVREFLLAALDDWLPCEPDEATARAIGAVTAAVTGQPWRERFVGAQETALAVFRNEIELPWEEMSAPMVAGLCSVALTTAPLARKSALARLEEARARHPADFALCLSAGLHLDRFGEGAAADRHFRRAAELRPDVSVGQLRAPLTGKPR